MASVFQKTPLRGKTLDDTLVYVKTNKALKQKDSTFSCRAYNVMQRDKKWSSNKDVKYKTAGNASCSDRNVIYASICCNCGKTVYVGKTKRMLKERIDEYLRDVCQQS